MKTKDITTILKQNIEKVIKKCQIIQLENIDSIIKRTFNTLNFLKDNPSYISGFYDAEGNVSSYPTENRSGKINFECEIKVSQNEQEIHILGAILLYFASKNIGYLKVNQQHKNATVLNFTVRNKNELRDLVSFFKKYPLYTRTKKDLENLQIILDIEKNYGFLDIKYIYEAAQASKKLIKKKPDAKSKTNQLYSKIDEQYYKKYKFYE